MAPRGSGRNLPKVIEAVRKVRALRDPAVRWRGLRAELDALGDSEVLKLDEARVLADICAHFADNGESVSLDDALRRMPDLDVHALAHGQLAQNGLLHVRPNTHVVPSLLALHRHLDLYGPLLQFTNEVLRIAKGLWDRKDTVVSTLGPHGLLGVHGVVTPPVAVRQLSTLIECFSLSPSIVPSAPGRVDIRNEIRNTGTISTLIAYQQRYNVRRAPELVVIKTATGSSAAQQNSLKGPMTVTRTSSVNILFFDLAGWSRLDPAQMVNYIEKALPRLAEVVDKFHCTNRNTWGRCVGRDIYLGEGSGRMRPRYSGHVPAHRRAWRYSKRFSASYFVASRGGYRCAQSSYQSR
jgi:hypothetical protein